MANKKYDWDAIILQQQSSGLSIKEYCLQNNINLHTFYNRKRWVEAETQEPLFQPVSLSIPTDTTLVSIRINSNLVEAPSSLLPMIIKQLL